MKKLFLLITLLPSLLYSQTYISKVIEYDDPNRSELVYSKEPKKVAIFDNFCQIELPNGKIYKGNFTDGQRTLKDGTTLNYKKFDKGGWFNITEKLIWINLYGTDINNSFTYYLYDYEIPSEAERKKEVDSISKAVKQDMFDSHKKRYGEFTATCIKDEEVRIGMKEIAIPIIMGQPIEIIETKTKYGIDKQFVYEYKYIYTKNGKVDAIQTKY